MKRNKKKNIDSFMVFFITGCSLCMSFFSFRSRPLVPYSKMLIKNTKKTINNFTHLKNNTLVTLLHAVEERRWANTGLGPRTEKGKL